MIVKIVTAKVCIIIGTSVFLTLMDLSSIIKVKIKLLLL